MKINKNKKGFTIVELVIVVAVIGILAAVLIPTFINLTNKANKASDDSLVKNLNTALAMQEQLPEDPENVNFHEAVIDLDNYGYKITNLITKSDEALLWNSKTNRFLLEENINKEENKDKKYEFWKISNSIDNSGYSIYAGNDFSEENQVEITNGVGFDVGYKNVPSVSYTRGTTDDGHDVVIRTNTSNTSLSIDGYVDPADNKKGDIIKHYGVAGELTIIKCAVGSYHENGKIAFAEINTGRIVLEENSEVNHIHINANENANGFDTVIISNNGGEEELPEKITRGAVTISEETLVVKVESNGASEDVFVYPDGSGTKGSTQKVVDSDDPSHNQNANVNSALGQLVLDNGSAGDKAQTVEEKEAAKQEAVQEAVIEEIEESDKYVARIGTTPFESLKDAVAAAATSAVIEMTANDPSAADLTVNKVVTIRMNGKTYGGKIVVATTGTNAVTVVGEANVDAITKLGNRYFNNLVFANNGTVTLLKDISTSQIYRTAYSSTASNWGLDLNGHTLTVTYNDAEGGIYVGSYYGTNHTLTINNGNLNFTGSSSNSVAMHVYGNLVLNNVNVTSSCGTAIKTEAGYWDGPGNVTLNNVVINSQGKGIDLEAYKSGNTVKQSVGTFSNVTINSSNIGVYINGANCTMENCTINSGSYAVQTVTSGGVLPNVVISGTGSIISQGYNTIDCKGGAMQISGNIEVSGGTSRTIYVQSSSLTIAGGTYLGNFGLGASGQLTIAGGTYNGNLIDVTQAGRLLVIGETQFEELVTYSITGSNGSYDVQVAA